MKKNLKRFYVTSLIIALTIGVGAQTASAALITDSQVEDQKRVVMMEIIDTLEANINLLQMVFIQKLEADIAYLKARVDDQSK